MEGVEIERDKPRSQVLASSMAGRRTVPPTGNGRIGQSTAELLQRFLVVLSLICSKNTLLSVLHMHKSRENYQMYPEVILTSAKRGVFIVTSLSLYISLPLYLSLSICVCVKHTHMSHYQFPSIVLIVHQ